MSSRTMVDGLLDAAEELLLAKPDSAAFRRRAVSTAYYAAFHAAVRVCAETFVSDVARTDTAYIRVYRALDHGPMANAFNQAPLRDHPIFRATGQLMVQLKEERHLADYSPPDRSLFPTAQVRALIDQARLVVDTLQDLNLNDRRLLATCLLFKERKS